MLSFFLAAFMHLALFGGGIAGYAHAASMTPPAHHHMHPTDSAGGPPN